MTLHIIFWLWRGWRPIYDRRDAIWLTKQLLAHGDLPSRTRLLCLTDRPTDWYKAKLDALGVLELPLWAELAGLNTSRHPQYPWLPAVRGTPNCFRRLRIFDQATQAELGIHPGDVVLSMDLDSVVMGSIGALVAPLFAGAVDFQAMEGRVAPVHGSLFGFRAGTCQHVWDSFDPKHTPHRLRHPPLGQPRYVGSDQAHMSTALPGARTWGTAENVWSFPRHSPVLRPKDPITYMSFAGSNKPRSLVCQQALPWVYEHAMKYWED